MLPLDPTPSSIAYAARHDAPASPSPASSDFSHPSHSSHMSPSSMSSTSSLPSLSSLALRPSSLLRLARAAATAESTILKYFEATDAAPIRQLDVPNFARATGVLYRLTAIRKTLDTLESNPPKTPRSGHPDDDDDPSEGFSREFLEEARRLEAGESLEDFLNDDDNNDDDDDDDDEIEDEMDAAFRPDAPDSPPPASDDSSHSSHPSYPSHPSHISHPSLSSPVPHSVSIPSVHACHTIPLDHLEQAVTSIESDLARLAGPQCGPLPPADVDNPPSPPRLPIAPSPTAPPAAADSDPFPSASPKPRASP